MPSAKTIDIEALLAPIPGDSPVGPDLRLDTSPQSLYQQVRDAREFSRDIEKQIERGMEGYSPDQMKWGKVVELGTKAIAEHSKDFAIAAWLCEALVRQQGFAGLRDGFELARKLAKEYWSGLYPQPVQEEGEEPPSDLDKRLTRVKPFEGLLVGALAQPILAVEVTGAGHTFAQHRAAKDLEKITDKLARQAKVDAGAVTMADFLAAVGETPPEFYKTLFEDLDQCLFEFREFAKILQQKCGKDEKNFDVAPPTAEVEKTLVACLELTKELGKSRGLFQDAPLPGTDIAVQGDGKGAVQGGLRNGLPPQPTREQAFAVLTELAAFFRRTEPHSPIAHHVEEAVRWGKMDLPTLLSELITDEKMRQQVFTRIGIPEIDDKTKKK
jgi:type VI secretion system protein ImpA